VAMAIHEQSPGNLRAFHGITVDDGNLWGQFLGARQDMNMGERFRQILVARSDPRLAEFFDPAPGQTQYFGADQFGKPIPAPAGGPPAVVDLGTRRAFSFRQPLVTWTENQLILAEAKFQTGDATAINHVNNVRLALGLTALAPPITLAQIMEEKYIATFQNIEAWNDYKRTCLPALTPGGLPQAAAIPERLPYAVDERQNNPNIPLPTDQPARNWNDPNAC
jgi:SusD/RagB-like outer membrane lipoprotein